MMNHHCRYCVHLPAILVRWIFTGVEKTCLRYNHGKIKVVSKVKLELWTWFLFTASENFYAWNQQHLPSQVQKMMLTNKKGVMTVIYLHKKWKMMLTNKKGVMTAIYHHKKWKWTAQKMKNDAYQQERGDEVEEASPHLTSSPKNSSEKYFINLCFFCILNLEKLRKRERIFFASIWSELLSDYY